MKKPEVLYTHSYGTFSQLLQFSTHQLREKMPEVCLHASLDCYFNGELVSNTPYACLEYHSFDIAVLIGNDIVLY